MLNQHQCPPDCIYCNYDPYKEWKEKTLQAMQVYSQAKKDGEKPENAKWIAYCETGILLW